MVGEPRRDRRRLWRVPEDVTPLRPGEYIVYDRKGRRFTTANKESYAERLARDLGGHVERPDRESNPTSST